MKEAPLKVDYEKFWADFQSAPDDEKRWRLLREFHEWTPGEYHMAREEAEHNNFSPYMYLPLPLYIKHQDPHVAIVTIVDEADDDDGD